jgi:hypothetical protein
MAPAGLGEVVLEVADPGSMSVTEPASWPRRLECRWRDPSGRVTVSTESPAIPVGDVRPGEARRMTFQLAAPKTPGSYRVEVELIGRDGQRLVRGVEPAVFSVEVSSARTD